jgi:hypothetical protein
MPSYSRGVFLGVTAISVAAGAFSYFRRRPNKPQKERDYVNSHLVGLGVFCSLLGAIGAYTASDGRDVIPLLTTSIVSGELVVLCDSEN